MFWKIMISAGLLGLAITAYMITWVVLKSVPEPSMTSWEVKATKYKEVLPAGWEPFAYDKASNLLILKRIKREEVNGG